MQKELEACLSQSNNENNNLLGVVAQAFNSSTQGVKTGRSLYITGQPGLHYETLSQINKVRI